MKREMTETIIERMLAVNESSIPVEKRLLGIKFIKVRLPSE